MVFELIERSSKQPVLVNVQHIEVAWVIASRVASFNYCPILYLEMELSSVATYSDKSNMIKLPPQPRAPLLEILPSLPSDNN